MSMIFQILNGFVWSMYAPFLRGHGFTGTQYGFIGSVSVFASIAGSLIGGWLADRYGSRRAIVTGVVFLGISDIILAMGSFEAVTLAAVLGGFGGGVSWVALTALISRVVEDRFLDRAFSYTTAFATMASALGSYMGFIPRILSSMWGKEILELYSMCLMITGIAFIAFSPLVLMVPEKYSPRKHVAITRKRVPWIIFIKLTIVELVIGFGAALSIHNIDYYFARKYNVSSAELGTIMGTEQLAMGLLMLLMPKLSQRVGGPLRAYILVASPSIPLIVAMTLVDNLVVAAALFIARTIMMNVANPLYQAFQMSLLPRDMRGRGSAVLGLAWQVPVGLGRAVGGALLDIDLELPLRATALLYGTAMGLLVVFFPGYVTKRSSSHQ